MNSCQLWACVILSISYVLALSALFVYVPWPQLSYNSKWRPRRKYFAISFFAVSVLFMLSAYIIGTSADQNWATNLSRLISNTFGFFSLDANYEEFIKICVEQAFGYSAFWATAFRIEFCAYVLIAPVVGGLFILDLVVALIPKLRLFVSTKKTKYVFSELNEHSIALAEDIARLSWRCKHHGRKEIEEGDKQLLQSEKKWLKSACIIFTDAYSDKESETSSELLTRAKKIGAICLKDDILERPFHFMRCKKKLVYFLMDSNEESNVTTAISLLSEEKSASLWRKTMRHRRDTFYAIPKDSAKQKSNKNRRVEMFVFTQSGESARLIDKAKETFVKNLKGYARKKRFKNKFDCELFLNFNLRVKCVNEYRNLVYQMLDDRKLLDALLAGKIGEYKNDKKSDIFDVWDKYFENNAPHKITVLIFGGGRIAKEYFKTVAWCYTMNSQISNDPPIDGIDIFVFAKNATELKSQLILEANEILKSEESDKDFRHADFSKEFALKDFHEWLKKKITESQGSFTVQKVLVAFGDDHMNYEIARWLKAQFEQQFGIDKTKQCMTIDFAIENNDLFENLKTEYEKSKDWCRLSPFSTLQSCFKYANININDLEMRGLEADRLHKDQKDKSIDQYFESNYHWKSSVAVALHTFYKWFSKAKLKIKGNNKEQTAHLYEFLTNSKYYPEEFEKLWTKIYWLEHKRWIAYMHSEGYRCPTAKEFATFGFDFDGKGNFKKFKTNQDKMRRLHACLLESEEKYYGIKQLKQKFDDAGLTVADLKNAITNLNNDNSDKESLADWLSKNIKIPDIDNLDRLSLLVTLTKEKEIDKEEEIDYKDYDIELSRGLCVQLLEAQMEEKKREIITNYKNYSESSKDTSNAAGPLNTSIIAIRDLNKTRAKVEGEKKNERRKT